MANETRLDASEDMRRRFRDGARRQFTPKLLLRDARALIWLAIALELSITNTIAHLVREELTRRGKDIDGPEFDPPLASQADALAA